jgi:hypothetical protein
MVERIDHLARSFEPDVEHHDQLDWGQLHGTVWFCSRSSVE